MANIWNRRDLRGRKTTSEAVCLVGNETNVSASLAKTYHPRRPLAVPLSPMDNACIVGRAGSRAGQIGFEKYARKRPVLQLTIFE